MMFSKKFQRAALLTFCMPILMISVNARADVGPPVEIKMAIDTSQAVSGQEYAGVFEVRVFKAGTLANFELSGEGWDIQTVDLPAAPTDAQPGVLLIPFTAVPADADSPIRLSLTWNGRRVRQAYEVGPSYFARAGKPYRLVRVPGDDAVTAEEVQPDARRMGDESPSGRGGSRHQFWFEGRIVYSRPGRDFSNPPDGDFDDPGDIPPATVGADTIDVQIRDNDTVGHEDIWSGYTDENGYFTTPVIDWPGSEFDPDPDLILYCETEVTGVVDVTDNSNNENTYWFETAEIEDFTGDHHDFGTLTPADTNVHPALHIFNSVVRTRRYIQEKPLYVTPEVQVEWPDDSEDGGAWYEHWTTEIHMSTEQQWHNETVSHEYGHHFIHSTYDPEPPEPDYCNEICDADYPDDCGHCMWCQETDHDAWNEGFPNWLADIVTRDYPDRYTHEPSGEPYVPLYTQSQETPGTCDGIYDEVALTEGFIAALLRDMDDQTQDDHDDDPDPDPNNVSFDGIFDMMCLGPVEIFRVTYLDQPITVMEFIDDFLARYPEYTDQFWPTAFNVGGPLYVSNFPADTQPPGAVLYCNSPTHPLGEGGSLPCITFEWWAAPDDVSGASEYSFLTTTDPAGEEPDEGANTVWGTDTCTVAGMVNVWELGEHYFCIKARDNDGNWSSEWSKFGPFEIIDCNGSGILDVCDIRCGHTGQWNICTIDGPSPCMGQPGCGESEDCQPNLIPDECDIANGTSEDCNLNAVPDECEDMFHWIGESGSWHVADNWLEGTDPNDNASVCINVGGDQTVDYSTGVSVVATLACSENMTITGSSIATLRLNELSWISGDLGLSGDDSKVEVNDRLDIAGVLDWTNRGQLAGSGATYANGGVHTDEIVYLYEHHLILDGASTSVGTGRVEFVGDSTFEIQPGSSYEHQGGTYFLNGNTGDNFINAGTLIKSVDPGYSMIYMYTENSGLIHVQTGTLQFYLYGTCSGDFIGDPGATLQFVDGGFNFLGSSSVVADNVIFGAGAGGWNSISGAWNVTGTTTVSKGQVTFTDEANIISYGPSFYITRGTVNFDTVIDDTIQFDTLSIGPGAAGDGIANFNSGDPLQVTNLIIGPGTIQSTGDITLIGLTTWNAGGGFGGTGTVNANADVLIGPSGDQKTLSNCTFNNAATATFLGGINRSSAVFNNLATGVMDIQADVGVFNNSFSDPFNNAGTVVKSAGAGTATIRGAVTNTGTVEVQSGVLSFTGSYGGSYIQTAGQTVLNGGDLMMTVPAAIQINGGLLTGDGTITGNALYNGGTTAPGLSAGVIDVVGNYTQTATGTLEIEIAGLSQGSEYDQLRVTGNATLGGELDVCLIDGFEPSLSDSFSILTYGSHTGQFNPVYLPALNVGLEWNVSYETNSLRLIVAQRPPCPGDLDGDWDVDLADLAQLLGYYGETSGMEYENGDLDGDGDVDLSDLAALLGVYGTTCP